MSALSTGKQAALGRLSLFITTLIWGSSFVILKATLTAVPTLWLLAFRFTGAALILLLAGFRELRHFDWGYVRYGALMGAALYCAYVLQTFGLAYTTPAKNAFLTATYCVIVPLLGWAFRRNRPDRYNLLAALLCLAGIACVSLTGSLTPQLGDALTLCCGFFYALHILLTSRAAAGRSAVLLTATQFVVVAALCWLTAPLGAPLPARIPGSAWLALAYLSIMCTAVCLLLQTYGQKHTPPHTTGIILTFESVFGAAFSVLIYREQLAPRVAVGFLLIFASIIISETKLDFLRKRRKSHRTPASAVGTPGEAVEETGVMNAGNAPARRKKLRKRILTVLLALVLAVVAAAGGVLLSLQLSPRPFVAFLRHSGVFDGQPDMPDFIADKADLVAVEADIVYPSSYSSNTLDIYYPADGSEAKATVFWLHGGGFIDGDKSGLRPFATALAENGYAVVSINYALAPETTYPAPVIQLGEACAYILQNSGQYPQLPTDRLVFGGDSAGAQIASQFTALQTSAALQEEMGLSALLAPETLRAAVLYCGPYDLAGFDSVEDGFTKLFIRQIGWAYSGQKDWRENEAASQLSTVNFVTPAYPPTFITDGNSGSFEAQGKELLAALLENGVTAQGLFYPESQVVLPHEYQFDYTQFETQARDCLTQTLAFLDAAVSSAAD